MPACSFFFQKHPVQFSPKHPVQNHLIQTSPVRNFRPTVFRSHKTQQLKLRSKRGFRSRIIKGPIHKTTTLFCIRRAEHPNTGLMFGDFLEPISSLIDSVSRYDYPHSTRQHMPGRMDRKLTFHRLGYFVSDQDTLYPHSISFPAVY